MADHAGRRRRGAKSDSNEPDAVAGDEAQGDVYVPPAFIGAVPVALEEHVAGAEGSRGLRVRCPRCKIRRFASLARDAFGIGPRSAEAQLGAWLRVCTGDPAQHARQRPSKAQVLAWLG